MRLWLVGGLVLGLASCGDKADDTSKAEGGGDSAPVTGDDSGPAPPDIDNDGDGISVEEGDCDDSDENIHPYADEICDEVDNDCDGAVDDDDASIDPDSQSQWYADADEDGYGAEAYTLLGCVAPEGYVAASDEGFDCNDLDETVYPGAEEFCEEDIDRNCDGSVAYEDADGDGWAACLECDDSDASSYPEATEVCDGVDNDCDGLTDDEDEDVDEDSRSTWYADLDEDGFGDESHPLRACDAPESTVPEGDEGFDCDDSDPDISPAADEICDGVDNDCNDEIDDGVEEGALIFYMDADRDGYGDPAAEVLACSAPDGAVAMAGDCDDHDDDIHPGAVELCDGEDNDCDGTTDGVDALGMSAWYMDTDEDGYGDPDTTEMGCSAPDGYVLDATDCDDASGARYPGADEYCNDVDDDCDGSIDEDSAVDATTWYPDEDGDGHGDASMPYPRCSAPAGYLTDSGDCDDSDPGVYPGAEEYCNDVDDDCDGTTDEDAGDVVMSYADEDGDGYGDPGAGVSSCLVPAGFVSDYTDCDDTDAGVSPGGTEYCNGQDDDCDGAADESDSVDAVTWYADADGDGYGDPGVSVSACTMPTGYVADGTDCDDTDSSSHSGSGGSGTETFNFTGGEQTFTVPDCIDEIQITVYGAEGRKASTTGSVAGKGGMASGRLSVSGGEVLYVYVGGQDGYNGGGDSWSGSSQACNGGGASDVRGGGSDIEDRVIVGGGGGGVSGETSWGDGGDGGGGSCGSNYCGGEGGHGYHVTSADSGGSSGGGGITGCHGGAGGGGGFASGGGGAVSTCYSGAVAGTGALGLGGEGSSSSSGCCHGYGAAGGGGGYYGGGGVAGGCCGGGGAGGGSSWTGDLTSSTFSSGVNSGNGQVVISW